MKREINFYIFCLWKAYFEKGYGLTNYAKYMIALWGLSSLDVFSTMTLGIAYAVLCFFIGWGWYRMGIISAEHEVQNRVNPFMGEVRKAIKKRKI